MALIRAYDRLGAGLDIFAMRNGAIGGDGPSRARIVDEWDYDRNTYALEFVDPSSDVGRNYTAFAHDASRGVILESAYFSDRYGRATVDLADIDVALTRRDLRDGATAWAADFLAGRDTVIGNRYADWLEGGARGDVLQGNDGADSLYGQRGQDELRGGEGGDDLYGGRDDDYLLGGRGSDLLYGGADADIFVFRTVREAGVGRTRDVVADFDDNRDFVDVSDIDANEVRRGDQAFDFVGRAAFSGDAGELRFKNGILSGDTDGDRGADFQVGIDGYDRLRAVDFIL